MDIITAGDIANIRKIITYANRNDGYVRPEDRGELLGMVSRLVELSEEIDDDNTVW